MESIVEVETPAECEDEAVRRQLEILASDHAFRTSKRSVAFLRYIVEQTLNGRAEFLKERTIGVEVFGRDPSYDTGTDHIVRTSATELRKRLAIYYGDEKRRSELRIALLPGSYVPQFTLPAVESETAPDFDSPAPVLLLPASTSETLSPVAISLPPAASVRWGPKALLFFALAALAVIVVVTAGALRPPIPRTRFWAPVLKANVPVLIAVGDVPNGPPSMTETEPADLPPAPKPGASNPPSVPFSDAVTIAKISSVLVSEGKQVVIRRENSSSFSDLREQPVVLVGAFNNEWSLRLTRPLRFSLAMDPARKIIYIRDREHPESRQWAWSIGPHEPDPNRANGVTLHDYALISRIPNSETGQAIVIIGGLFTYGTEAAGEFLADPQLMSLTKSIPINVTQKNLQIVLETDVTQETPGPPRIVAASSN